MKYFFGVMSKNQVDSIIQFSLKNTDLEYTFIPSRRQIEYNGGYVNNWTTQTFTEYVKSLNSKINIERDHGGPGQGLYDDDGFDSLKEDCKFFDLIHIDPWKKYSNLSEGIKWSIDMIRFCYSLNPNIEYEIGTEEAIRPFTIEEIETIIISVKNELEEHIYKKIKYCVVQCGNGLCNGTNSGNFDKNKLKNMVDVVNKYNFISKEHNGDWVSINIIKQKKEYKAKQKAKDLVNRESELDWASLVEALIEWGIRNATLFAIMPSETSSLISNSTNGIDQIRSLVTFKASNDGPIPQAVPEIEKHGKNYELLWDNRSMKGMIQIAATIQKWFDQSMSLNLSYNPKHYPENKIPLSVFAIDVLTAYQLGIKTLYYHNTRDGSGEIELKDDSCDSCKI